MEAKQEIEKQKKKFGKIDDFAYFMLSNREMSVFH